MRNIIKKAVSVLLTMSCVLGMTLNVHDPIP